MKTRTLKQLLLYNYRYFFAQIVVLAFIAYFLCWRLGNVGPGLSAAEINAAAHHTSLAKLFSYPLYPVHAATQWASLKVFGVNPISIRLPDVALAAVTAYVLYNLLKKWLGRSTALLSAALFISADWFLYVARTGAGAIELSFWLALALLSITKVLEHKAQWIYIFSLSIIGLFFVPFGIYCAITLLVSLFIARVIRERFEEAKLWQKITCAIPGISALLYLAYTIMNNPHFGMQLLGISQLPTIGGYFYNAFVNAANVVAILPNTNPANSPTNVFIIRFFEIIFILFGVIMFWRTRVNRLNVIVLSLSIVLVLAGGLSKDSSLLGLLLVPAAIYITAGIRYLMHRWKLTFPKNPYARVTAYIPLSLLFVLVVTVHYLSYFVLWPSNTDTHVAFTRDFMLVKNELDNQNYKDTSCLVQTDDSDFKALLSASRTVCKPVFPDNPDASLLARTLILRPTFDNTVFTDKAQVSHPLVSETKNNSLRWIVVRASAQ